MTRQQADQLKDLLSPGHWCQGSWAKSAKGRRVAIHSRAASQWCLSGAIANLFPSEPCADVRRSVRQHIREDIGIGRWNDTPGRTLEEVHALIDSAVDAP